MIGMKLTAPQSLRVIEAILRLRVFTQQGLSDETGVSIGQVNSVVSFLLNKGFVDKTRKGYALCDEIGLLKAVSLFSDGEDCSYLKDGDGKRKIAIALKGSINDINRIFEPEKNKRIRIGLIGYGGVGRNHYNAIMRIDDLELVAVCDIKKHDFPSHIRFYNSYHEMIGSEMLDAVVIATPSSTHEDIVSAALRNNLYVLCESPCTDSSKALGRIIDDDSLFIGYTEWFNPVMQKLLGLLDERIIFLDAFRQGPYPKEYRERNALFSLGLHDILNAQLMLKDLIPISCISSSFHGSTNLDAFRLLLRSQESIVSMSIDWASSIKERKYVLGLESKTIYADLVRQEITIYDGNRRDKSYTYGEQIKGVVAGEMRSLMVDKKEPFIVEYEAFISFIRNESEAIRDAKEMKKAYREAYAIMEHFIKKSK
jgi:predicted dehydrogenase